MATLSQNIAEIVDGQCQSAISGARGIFNHRWMDNVAVVACQRRGIAHPQPRIAVLLARHLVNSANGYARCSKDAVMPV